jgi:DNA repair protein RadC
MELVSSVGEVKLVYLTEGKKSEPYRNSKQVHEEFLKVFDPDTINLREEMWMFCLNRANEMVASYRVSVGGTSGCIVDSKMVFQTALLSHSSSIILAHNHPSGNLQRSTGDDAITKKLQKGCTYLDIVLLDHLIITKDGYFSYKDDGVLD